MNRRMISIFLTVCSLSVLLCGCEKGTVDYDIDTQQGTLEQETSPLNLESVDKWEEEISISEDKNVSIQANVKIPEVEQMSVMELQEVTFDEAYKKKVIQKLYGTLEVYANEQENWPKDRWETYIKSCEEELEDEKLCLLEMKADSTGQYDASIDFFEGLIEELQDEIEKCTKQMEAAPETVAVTTDFSGESYYGTINGLIYEIDFYLGDYSEIRFSVADASQVCPDELKDAKKLSYGGSSQSYIVDKKNLCTITEEEAKKQAEEVLSAMGWTEFVWQDTEVLEWSDFLGEADGTSTTNHLPDGYCFTCEKGVGDFAFGEFDSGYSFLVEKENYCNETATICINDHGIVSVSVGNPVNFVQETENVSLLSLDTVKGIIKKELSENPDKYFNGKSTIHFIELQLNYLRIEDESRAGYFSYVPAWRLCNMTGTDNNRKISSVPVFVNAIDGSIIDLEDVIRGRRDME